MYGGVGVHCCKHLGDSTEFSQCARPRRVVGRECPDKGGFSRRKGDGIQQMALSPNGAKPIPAQTTGWAFAPYKDGAKMFTAVRRRPASSSSKIHRRDAYATIGFGTVTSRHACVTKNLLQKRICLTFFPDGCGGSVSGIDRDVITEGKHFCFDGIEQRFPIRAGEVGASDAACEKDIT
jgi:hypothetical protein